MCNCDCSALEGRGIELKQKSSEKDSDRDYTREKTKKKTKRDANRSSRWEIDNKNLTHFTNRFFVPELASSLFDNAVKTLCAQAQARALPGQH